MKNKIVVSLSKLCLSTCFCSCLFCLSCSRLQAAQSNEIDIFVKIEKSFLWRTAESSSPLVSWETPSTAVSATLEISSFFGRKSYDVSDKTELTLQLETPDSAASENVYDLTLTFNCGESNVVRRGQIGVVRGLGTSGAVGIVADIRKNDAGWSKLRNNRAVLQIPAETTKLTVDGETVETGLDGTVGWYGWKSLVPKTGRAPYELSLVAADDELTAGVIVLANGLSLILR